MIQDVKIVRGVIRGVITALNPLLSFILEIPVFVKSGCKLDFTLAPDPTLV